MRRTDVWLLVVWFVLVAIGVGAFIVPAANRCRVERREIDRLKAEYAQPFNGPETVERLTRDLETLQQFGEGRMTPIPEESDIAGLMGSLSRTLSDLQLEQRDITTRTGRDLDGASVLPVAVTLFGPFERVYEAIGRIEALPRLVRVGRLRVTADDGTPASRNKRARLGTVRAELTIDAFYKPTTLSEAGGDRR